MTLIALTCFLSANEVPGDRAFKISQTIAHLMRLGDYIRKNAHFRFYHRIIEKKNGSTQKLLRNPSFDGQ